MGTDREEALVSEIYREPIELPCCSSCGAPLDPPARGYYLDAHQIVWCVDLERGSDTYGRWRREGQARFLYTREMVERTGPLVALVPRPLDDTDTSGDQVRRGLSDVV